MPTTLSGNRTGRPGRAAFDISGDQHSHFVLGERDGGDYWLEGEIVNDTEFLFNGRLYPKGRNDHGTIIDNFPKGPVPVGWTRVQRADDNGFALVGSDGTALFAYRIDGLICTVTVNIYSKAGEIIAESSSMGFRVHRGPANFGRNSIVFL